MEQLATKLQRCTVSFIGSGDLGHEAHLLLVVGEIEERSGFAGNYAAGEGSLATGPSVETVTWRVPVK